MFCNEVRGQWSNRSNLVKKDLKKCSEAEVSESSKKGKLKNKAVRELVQQTLSGRVGPM